MRALLLSILTFMTATPALGQVGPTSEAGQASAPSLRSLIELRPTEAPASDLAGPEEDAPLDWVTGSDVGVGFAGALLGGAVGCAVTYSLLCLCLINVVRHLARKKEPWSRMQVVQVRFFGIISHGSRD